jgi:hypothetical protein
MNGIVPRLKQHSIYELANELCKLFDEQFDALQQDLTDVELEQYLERRSRIHQLQIELKGIVSRPS